MVTTASLAAPRFIVTAIANNPSYGSVTGGGIYFYGDTATLRATPYEGYAFTAWSDSIVANPRAIRVTCDTMLTAVFDPVESINTVATPSCIIYPNPAGDAMTASIAGISGKVCIVVLDMRGREVMQESTECSTDCDKHIDIKGLAAGAYILRITSENTEPIVRRLVVK